MNIFYPAILLIMANQNNNNSSENINSSSNNGEAITSMEATYRRLAKKLEPRLLENQRDEGEESESSFCQYWIGVAGGPGSGKSTVAQEVADRLNALHSKEGNDDDDVAIVIGMDGWHWSQHDLIEQYGEEAMKRRGAPWTFDVESMCHDVSRAKEDGEADLPEYSRAISNPVFGGTKLSRSHKIVFVEGLYVLMKDDKDWGKLFHLWDETWFIVCPSREEQIDRLVERSLKTWGPQKIEMWGEGEQGARKRAEFNDVPNMNLVDPCRNFADEMIVTKQTR
jgi:pantothenate kinase